MKEIIETREVTQKTYCRAETDRTFYNPSQLTGGINNLFSFRQVTSLDRQTVVRMNKDTLYTLALVDTSKGTTITVPEMPAGRYFSVLLLDNDHYCPGVIYTSGTHQLPQDTKYLAINVRIQLLHPDDPADIALVNQLQDQFVIKANSADPFPEPNWDKKSLEELKAKYNAEFAKFDLYPDGWMGKRGEADETTRHIGCAGAWGLFPNEDAVYINYNGHLPADLDNVKKIQAQYVVKPLSAFLGQPAPKAAPSIDFPKPLTPITQKTSLEFYTLLNFYLQFCPTHPSEQTLMDRFAKIGVGAGRTFDASKMSPETKQAIEAGMADAWAEFMDLLGRINKGEVTSGDAFGTREYLKNNYLYRMGAAVTGIYGLSKEEAIYLPNFVDGDGQKLNGVNRYTLRFKNGQLPPANSFWSLPCTISRPACSLPIRSIATC